MISPRIVIVGSLFILLAVAEANCRQEQQKPNATDGSRSLVLSEHSVQYCDEVESLTKGDAENARIFADLSSGTVSEAPQWREFRTEAERQAQDTGENLNQNAFVWFLDSRVVLARFTFQSPSRDWAHYVDYCFNRDGTLQRARSELRTFYGHIRRVRAVVRESDGGYVETRSEMFDLESGKPTTPPDSFEDQEVPLVRSVGELPFANLLGAV